MGEPAEVLSAWEMKDRPPGGYSVWKRVPTADRPLRSGGCRAARWLKKGAVLLLYCKIRELSESLHPIFYIIQHLYTFNCVLETF